MKIRRMLATAVAAAVTTPLVLLSAAPAFADTKPSPASTQKPTAGEDEKPPTLVELKAAVELAQKEYDAAVAEVAKANAAIEALDKADHPLVVAASNAKKAAEAAAAAKTAADTELAKAEEAREKLAEDAPDEEKQAADEAVATAKAAAEAATTAKTAADTKAKDTAKALEEARVAAFTTLDLARKVEKAAAKELTAAKEELELFEEIGQECADDKTVKVSLDGPEKITAGTSALFSLRVSNTSQRTLDEVEAYAFAAAMPDSIEDEDFFEEYITVEWSSADVLEWTPLSDDGNAIEIGELLKGGHYDVKLRLTVAPKTPAGPGVVFAMGAYENNDGSCGIGEEPGTAEFDILAAKGDKPKPTPTPSSTTTPAPVPTTGNTGTTQQGGSSSTPVTDGNLAATGSNDALPMIGLAAAGAVALGAGAVFVARRRKAGSQA
ncbi:LAETG motif-containing sortase-dependent surface protein [Streptomyces sp. NPDC090135]|uniref:LAETG motif-containing sortase-dependent surface protein n=1 Tax=Streptomyces sp. NPDC090135 TaxID=3365957 RepID=UPI00380F0FE3